MSRLMGNPTICICENKDADQLRSNREADQRMGNPTICICENKDADQLRSNREVTAKLISAFVFATRIVQSLFFLNPKFQVSSLLL